MTIKPHTREASAWADLLAELQGQNAALRLALHDAINRPKGVVPASADPFYNPAICDARYNEEPSR